MAKLSGKTMTEFTNLVIIDYQKEHSEILEQAKSFLNIINSGFLIFNQGRITGSEQRGQSPPHLYRRYCKNRIETVKMRISFQNIMLFLKINTLLENLVLILLSV